MWWQINIPTTNNPVELDKLRELEKIKTTLVFINNILQDDPEIEKNTRWRIKYTIEAKEIPWWVIVLIPWKKNIKNLKTWMDNEMSKYPEAENWFLAYFIDEPTLEWYEVLISDHDDCDHIVDGVKYVISPYKFEKKLIISSTLEESSELRDEITNQSKVRLDDVLNH